MMSAPAPERRDAQTQTQTADGGTVERQTWSETDRVWTAWTALHNNKHGPPGAAAPVFQGFPRCSQGPLDLPRYAGLSVTVMLPKRLAIPRLLSINAPSDRETSCTECPGTEAMAGEMTINQSIR